MSYSHERFRQDVSAHEMTVIRDDGLHRHLRFGKPGTYCMSFEVVTWPGSLCYTGDMGTFVFSRLRDMFEFFRGRDDGRIDFSYWAEKAQAVDKPDGLQTFSEDRFHAAVKADFDSFVEGHELSADKAAELWQLIEDDVLSCGDNEHEGRTAAAMRFRWAPDHVSEPRGREVFPDFWEHNMKEYTPRFIWCCYALRWAIATYDASKVAVSCAPATPGGDRG